MFLADIFFIHEADNVDGGDCHVSQRCAQSVCSILIYFSGNNTQNPTCFLALNGLKQQLKPASVRSADLQ